MAWSMPTTGQWNPGIAMTPDMNVGPYTPEQWALMQQQNWQQWAQWQQQYAQWQSQYGEKYAQQMQAFQAMAGPPPIPPPSSAAPPPAPPPPDKPPPPPHENDQPLYGNILNQDTSVPPPVQNQNSKQISYNNSNISTGNNVNWPYGANVKSDAQQLQSVNTEALKKLAEEERLFDIQFKKWEEEIEKWRTENVNHPDKEAYKEYEQKFEACRVQLLERRQQMKIKRARLMGNTTQVTLPNNSGNISTTIPPQLQNTNINNHPQNEHPNKQIQKNLSGQSHTIQNVPQYQQYSNMTQQGYSRNNNKSIDPQDRYESYQPTSEDYNKSCQPATSNFLPTSQSKGIPGLDLVPEVDKSFIKQPDILNIPEDTNKKHQQQKPIQPDYSKISKGINNILGDEKIMNILSMVTNKIPPGQEFKQNVPGQYRQENNVQYNSNYSKNNYDTQQEMSYKHHNKNSYTIMQEKANTDYSEPPPYQKYSENYNRRDFRQNEMQQEQCYDGRNNNTPRSSLQSTRPNVAPPRPLISNLTNQPNSIDYSHGGFERRDINESIKPVIIPGKPKWVDEPLFTPTIIVDYEHKSLRLKARGFIEPVHMFDYDHKSKDGESSHKKDFEKEIDELFTRKSRRPDPNDDWNNSQKYNERRIFRDDQRDRAKQANRDDRDMYNRRVDIVHEERRRDDRDRFGREDYERRDRPSDYERTREPGRERDYRRDRDFGREREIRDKGSFRDREQLRDRDFGRDRDFIRDRDLGRDRELGRDVGKERDMGRDRELTRERDTSRYKDFRKEDSRNRSRSRDRDSRKREHSKDNDSIDSSGSKKTRESKEISISNQGSKPQHIVMIDDLLEPPGRDMRPEKIVIILRGPPGSGKSYLAKLIRDKEAEHGGTVRIMSIDDYFMQESEVEEKDPTTGKIVKKPSLRYEYDEKSEEVYLTSLKRAFKRSITDGYFTFLIYDSVNEQLKSYADIWNFSRQNGFQVYICTMELDIQLCFKRNIHNRSLGDIEVIVSRFFPTPAHHIQLDATTLLQNASIPEVQMEDADDVTMEDAQNIEVESIFTSKWEKMDDAAQLARLDGTSKPLRPSRLSMEDYLQLDDWTPTKAKPGKKTVRWADIEERRQQEKMRAIGFVVGQTDWNRMTDPTMGSSALTQTKYIERVRRF